MSSSRKPRAGALLGGVVAFSLLGSASCQNASADPPPPAKPPPARVVVDKAAAACTQVTGGIISEAFGYKHVVSLHNGCDKPVECEVWTDVDPSPRHTLRVEKGETAQVITRIGSPASEVKAFKECRFR